MKLTSFFFYKKIEILTIMYVSYKMQKADIEKRNLHRENNN